MWKKILNFYQSNKYIVWWTIAYFAATWAIMRYMFNFDIFSSLRWHQLMHAHLHGFAGMVFGILILASIPMYVATSVIVARTHAPLISIKIPERVKTFFINAFTQTPMVEEADNTQPAPTLEPQPAEPLPEKTEPAIDKGIEKPIPASVPGEMRVAYMRARENLARTPTVAPVMESSAGTSVPSASKTTAPEIIEPEMPIPTDFDIADIDDMIDSVPTFTDINFDDDDDDDTPIEINDIETKSDTTTVVADFLKSKSIPYEIVNEVVTTDKFAVVAHTDPDFWVADSENWFAAGKTRKSPIALVKTVANSLMLQPVLYLGADNILDIENMRTTWENDGIRIITDLNELI